MRLRARHIKDSSHSGPTRLGQRRGGPSTAGGEARDGARGDQSRPARTKGVRLPRPSLLLWRYRHFVVALCLGGAVLVALAVLRPAPGPGQQVFVVNQRVASGQVLTDKDVSLRTMPKQAIPSSGLLQGQAVGLRAAVALEPGTVLTNSMTTGDLTRDLSPEERVIQVPVEVGAELAQPGTRVDIVGPAPPLNPGTQDDDTQAQPALSAFGQSRPGVISHGARVLTVQSVSEGDKWTAGRKVTLVTLAVTASDASLVVGAATNGALGVVLSP